eukprot:3947954-Prymnesium_polylepis.2
MCAHHAAKSRCDGCAARFARTGFGANAPRAAFARPRSARRLNERAGRRQAQHRATAFCSPAAAKSASRPKRTSLLTLVDGYKWQFSAPPRLTLIGLTGASRPPVGQS